MTTKAKWAVVLLGLCIFPLTLAALFGSHGNYSGIILMALCASGIAWLAVQTLSSEHI